MKETPAKKPAPKRKRTPKKKKPIASAVASLIPGALDPKAIGRAARGLVLAFAEREGLTGEEKHSAVVAELARKVDALLVWPSTPLGFVAESLDGVAAQVVLGGVVKHAYQALKDKGQIL